MLTNRPMTIFIESNLGRTLASSGDGFGKRPGSHQFNFFEMPSLATDPTAAHQPNRSNSDYQAARGGLSPTTYVDAYLPLLACRMGIALFELPAIAANTARFANPPPGFAARPRSSRQAGPTSLIAALSHPDCRWTVGHGAVRHKGGQRNRAITGFEAIQVTRLNAALTMSIKVRTRGSTRRLLG